MPRSQCDFCCAPEELARNIDTYRSAVLQILCAMLGELETANDGEMLGSVLAANFNSTADQAINMNSSLYTVTKILVTGASISLTTAVGGVYQAASKTNALVANTQVYSSLTTSAKALNATLTALATGTVFTENNLFLSLTTPQGAPATANIYIFGNRLD